MEYWAELNKCDVIEYLQEDQTKITKYLDSKSNKEVWYYLIENLDHSFPFEDQYNIDAPALVWEFFIEYYNVALYFNF